MRSASRILNSSFGFTLIELVLTIVIVGVLASAGIAYFNSASSSQRLVNAVKELQTNLRYAQNTATSGVNLCSSGGEPLRSRLYLPHGDPSSSYSIYQWCYYPPGAPGGFPPVKTQDLGGLEILSTTTYGADKVTAVTFEQVTGAVKFWKGDTLDSGGTGLAEVDIGEMKLVITDGANSRQVVVNKGGNINVQ